MASGRSNKTVAGVLPPGRGGVASLSQKSKLSGPSGVLNRLKCLAAREFNGFLGILLLRFQ